MKKLNPLLWLVAAIILLSFTTGTKPVHKTDIATNNLKGSVKSVTDVRINEPVQKGGNQKGELKASDTQMITITKYNVAGNVIRRRTTYLVKGLLYINDSSEYNDKGNIIEGYAFDTTGNVVSKAFYKYDDNGNLTETDALDPAGNIKGKELYKCDAAGNVIEKSIIGAQGRGMSKTFFKYDGNGNKIEEVQDYGNGKQMKTVHNYDSKGNLAETIGYGISGNVQNELSYEYDDKGNTTKQTSKFHQTNSADKTATSVSGYEYDSAGNWIKETFTQPGSKYIFVTKRAIEYY